MSTLLVTKAKEYRFWIKADMAPPLTSCETWGSCPPPHASFSSSLNSTCHTRFSTRSESCLPFQVSSHHSKPHATYKNEPITNPQSGHCFPSRALLFISFTLNILPNPSIPPLNFSLSTWLISTYPTEPGADTFQTCSISFHSIP